MGVQKSGWQSAGAGQIEDLANIWTFSGDAPTAFCSRSPSAAQTQFGGMNQIISGPVTGPIFSNGGAITVTKTRKHHRRPGRRRRRHLLDHEADEPRSDQSAPQAPRARRAAWAYRTSRRSPR